MMPKYRGYTFDPDISAYICDTSGLAASPRWMAANKAHLLE